MGHIPVNRHDEAGEHLTCVNVFQVGEKRFHNRLNDFRFIKKTPDEEESVDKGNITETGNVIVPVIRTKIHCYAPSL